MRTFFQFLAASALFAVSVHAEESLPAEGLIVHLDADAGIETKDTQVLIWRNKADFKARDFKATRENGRPEIRKAVAELNGHNAIVFKEQEVLNDDEDAFDGLTTGSGYTWVTVIAAYPQTGKLKDVNVFLGNLRNGMQYEGFWAGFDDDGSVWMGTRNGKTFGRWNGDNPKVKGPKLDEKRFYVVAGRMGSGTETATLDLFVNAEKPVATATVPVFTKANASKLAVGTERDAKEHPGVESFDGEMAKVLIWQRALSDVEMKRVLESLTQTYGIK